MSRRMGQYAVLAAGTAIALGQAPGTARAAGFQLREMSAQELGLAFAGSTAQGSDLSTIYQNPAAMTLLPGTWVQADVTYVVPEVNFSGSAGFGPYPYSGGDGGDAGEDKVVPAFYALMDAGQGLKAGLSINAPFGLATKYDDDWVGRYFALESEIENVVITPSIAWQATDKLSLGAGVQFGRAEATLSSALNLSPLGLPDGKSTLEGDGWGYGFTLGMLYEFTPTTRVGLSYRSKVKYTLEGTAKISDVPGLYQQLVPSLQSSDAEAEVTMPDVVSLGVYHEINPQWAVMSDVSWTNWSTFDELRVSFDDGRPDSVTEEDWHDSWFVSIGAEYRLSDEHTFRFGVAYDQSPVPEENRTARIPDSDRYWLSLGYSYTFAPDRSLNFGYTHLFFDDSDIDEMTDAGTLSGSYSGSADLFSAGLRIRF